MHNLWTAFNLRYVHRCVRFEVLTALAMKIIIFLSVTSYILVEIRICFGAKCCLLQGRKELLGTLSVDAAYSS
jgi:hypothetical protein